MRHDKAPFPWFGGKSQAAPVVWAALGDVDHYVEPFAGSLAVLLGRPHEANRAYYSETVNDADGLLVNAWRAIQLHPDETAEAASNPVAEADLHARHVALVRWRADNQLEHIMGDPAWCDPLMAGWWLWGCCSWIGSGWCSGEGPWTADASGRIVKQARSGAREPGVNRQLPHVANNGMGVNHAALREPGVSRKLPHVANDGMGVNHAALREPGVNRQLPHVANDGKGVNHHALREPGVEYHDVTMPRLREWFAFLSARLRHVRVLNGDWSRAVTNGVTKSLSVRRNRGACGVFLDPPYADTAGRCKDLYAVDSIDVAHAVREWALAHGEDPKRRIVFAGFCGEHADAFEQAGWRSVEWYNPGFLRGGMANVAGRGASQQERERLWLSPHCLSDG